MKKKHVMVHVPPPSMTGHGTWRCLHRDCAWIKADGFGGSFTDEDVVRRNFQWAHEFMELDKEARR